ncbi:hypothetical protein EJ05DRAFT_485247 [Pseudovirgaria hyperparasitica]|uniref:Uncharacterized protein n=1 Tax=Pseudovirgaria hyperparasitica TaxID=470096 RepID=A0A6A6WAY2_9PEZI|nr:uncharacterized protein EJ05DRAFT_485247 [Pseudovirgaria hyperparasitica]KAF2759194.1 hypothetical protein EJ05DRAFT_485247 [Pseudovirgaria hyperparasitica]
MQAQNESIDRSVFTVISPLIQDKGKELHLKKKRAQFVTDHDAVLKQEIKRWTLPAFLESFARLSQAHVFRSPREERVYFGVSQQTVRSQENDPMVGPSGSGTAADAVADPEPAPSPGIPNEPVDAESDPKTDDTAVADSDPEDAKSSFQPQEIILSIKYSQPPLSASLPQRIQRPLLDDFQKAIEQACFDFAERQVPRVLSEKRWESADAVEVTKWRRIIPQSLCAMYKNDSEVTLTGMSNMFHKASQLRNAAVHRERLSVSKLDYMLDGSVVLAGYLRDKDCEDRLRNDKDLVRKYTSEVETDQKKRLKMFKKQVDEKKREFEICLQQMGQQVLEDDARFSHAAYKRLEQELQTSKSARSGRLQDRVGVLCHSRPSLRGYWENMAEINVNILWDSAVWMAAIGLVLSLFLAPIFEIWPS